MNVAIITVGDLGNELLDHLIAYVGLQQGQADLPHGLLHVGLGQPPLAAQPLKGGGELFSQSFKCHGYSFSSTSAVSRMRRARDSSSASSYLADSSVSRCASSRTCLSCPVMV